MTAKVPSAQHLLRKASRRDHTSATKRRLVEVARDLFSEQGYATTSLEQIVAGAEVTKGALYHHFRGKQELFEAAFDVVEEEATARIRAALTASGDPWEQAVAGVREFLAVARTTPYRRLVIQEGPSVLGYERFREHEARRTFALVEDVVRSLFAGSVLPPTTLEAFTRIFYGALSATAAALSSAEDPHQVARDSEEALVLVLAGIRSVVESGRPLPGAGAGPGVTDRP